MTIFAKRISRPNQLATLREIESRADVGKVLWTHQQLCIISGLNNDAPIGCMLSFVTGGTGVLMHHRSDNLVFALILGGASTIKVGERVECKIKGVLQVVDEAKGPVTRKDYEFVMAPAGDALFGRAVNFFGFVRSLSSPSASPSLSPSSPIGFDKSRPLINAQVDMKGREQITESLHTGVKAIDILTPLGRGMNLLVIGPRSSGKGNLAMDAILAQTSSGVKCVLALTCGDQQLAQVTSVLSRGKVLENTAIVSADQGASIGERLACIFTACSIGERVRDEGGHCLVILDTVLPLVEAWDELIGGLSGLGADKVLEGLVKDKEGKEVARPKDENDDNELVDYQGMLVSAAVAQRRGFFSTLFMRPAKLNRSSGGGSMTLLPLVPGQCATGVSKKAIDMSKYQTLSEEQKAKIKEALERKAREEDAVSSPSNKGPGQGEMPTEVIEEFISISDGQLVLTETRLKGSYQVNPRLSITRVGTRAYPKALEEIAPQVRLDLSQAEDARKFSSSLDDPVIQRYDAYARRLAAALVQESGRPASLGEQVVVLLAIQNGICDEFEPESMSHFLKGALKYVQAGAFSALQEVNTLRILTAKSEQRFIACLGEYRQLMRKIETL